MDDARSYSDEVLEAMRRRAIAARGAGYPAKTVAEILGVRVDTVHRWMTAWRADALPGPRSGCPVGHGRILKPDQEADLRRIVADELPANHGIASPTWTRRAVGELVESRCGVRLPERTVGEYLRRWGMTSQRAARRNPARDPDEVARWEREEFPAIRARAEAEGAALLFLDETGVAANPTPGYGYAPAGTTPVAETEGRRWRTNVSTAIGADGTLVSATYGGRLDGEAFLAQLREIVAASPRKVHLVLDRHPAHRARLVKEWVAEHAGRIELHELPARAPELNPVEYLNHDLKANVFREGYPKDRADLLAKTRRFLERLAAIPYAAARYFLHPDVSYARA